jgi:hypothetical protein
MKKIIRENSLSIVMFSLFLATLIGLVIVGFYHENEQLGEHNQPPKSLVQFVASGSFTEAVFENWESEFLQMGSLVLFTIWLVQKGAADSKKLSEDDPKNAPSRYSIIRASSWDERVEAVKESLYANSLTIALFGIFILSFILHAVSGTAAANEEARWHGGEQQSIWGYIASSQFWFESFQNWQSEFLAVGALLVLSIFLRQRYSPESKPVEASDKKTGD